MIGGGVGECPVPESASNVPMVLRCCGSPLRPASSVPAADPPLPPVSLLSAVALPSLSLPSPPVPPSPVSVVASAASVPPVPAASAPSAFAAHMAPLPGTPSPQPHPLCQDGILKGGPRDRVWTTGPYPSCRPVCKVVAPDRGHPQAKKRVKVRAIGRFTESATPTFLKGLLFFLTFFLGGGGGQGWSRLACTARRSQAIGARFTFGGLVFGSAWPKNPLFW